MSRVGLRRGGHLVPGVRHPAQRQHAAVRAAQGHRGGGRARRVLRGAALAPVCPASRGSTSRTRARRHRRALAPLDPGRPEKPGEFEGWFTYALQRGTSRNGVFGAKMMWNYFDDFRQRIASCPGSATSRSTRRSTSCFPQLRIVFVRRRDKVAQAVSLWKAIQTQQWRNEAEPTLDAARRRVPLPGAQAPGRRAAPLGRPLGGLVPRHRPRTHPGDLRGVRRHPGGDGRPGARRPRHRPA